MQAFEPARSDPPAIIVKGASKTFGAGQSAVAAVAATDVTLEAGTTTALVGPSGCGKSTLLRMIAGLETATAGEILIGGATPRKVSADGELSVAFQDPSLLPWRTVAGNIHLARRLGRKGRDGQAVQTWIDRVGLSGFEDRRPAELSGGMRQRAAIARCLATDPRVLLLDEPFGAVDELTRRRLNIDLPPLWEKRGATTLLVTHSVSEAVLLSDRVLVLSHRPARILHDIDIPLARPWREDMIDTPQFRSLVAQVISNLTDEKAQGTATPKIAAVG